MSSNISSTNFGNQTAPNDKTSSPVKTSGYIISIKKDTSIANSVGTGTAGGVNFKARSYAEYIAYKKAQLRNN